MNLNQITLGVSDIERSKTFYERLGFRLLVDTAHYCRFLSPSGGTTFSLHVAEIVSPGTAKLYLESEDVDAEYRRLKAAGVVFESEPQDQTWLWREAAFRDPDGYSWILYHAGTTRIDPPWRVKSGD